jgi:hypothetical protein
VIEIAPSTPKAPKRPKVRLTSRAWQTTDSPKKRRKLAALEARHQFHKALVPSPNARNRHSCEDTMQPTEKTENQRRALLERSGYGHLAGPARPFILNRGETDPCEPVEVTEICKDGHEAHRTFACTKRSCTASITKWIDGKEVTWQPCQKHALRERTALLRPLANELFPQEWCVLVLPYAPELREELRFAQLMRASRQLAAARFENILLDMNGLNVDHGWRLGIVSVDHPTGDKCDDCARRKVECPDEHAAGRPWKPHHNFLFPAMAFGPNGERHRIRHSLTRAELAELRDAWAEVQEVGQPRPLARKADLHFQYLKPAEALNPTTGELVEDTEAKKKRNHALKYFPRTFPHWTANGQQLSYLGAFGCSVINELPEVREFKARAKQEKQDLSLCQTCKGEIVKRTCRQQHAVPMHYRAVFGGSSP